MSCSNFLCKYADDTQQQEARESRCWTTSKLPAWKTSRNGWRLAAWSWTRQRQTSCGARLTGFNTSWATRPVEVVLADIQGAARTRTDVPRRSVPTSWKPTEAAFCHPRWPGHSSNVHLLRRSVIRRKKSHRLESAPGGCTLDGVGQLF